MDAKLRLLAVLAHPDDESLGTGSTLAKYAAEGIQVELLTATRGERGWFGDPAAYPGMSELGRQREAELRAATEILGVGNISFLDYTDGDLDRAPPAEAIARIVECVRRLQPHVVITFAPDGAYGHPDHIAISQLTTAALVCAADAAFAAVSNAPPHRVAKLYYMIETAELMRLYESLFGEIVMTVDNTDRRPVIWPDWAVTTWIDGTQYWPTVWHAVQQHRTQLPTYNVLAAQSAATHARLWGMRPYYRAYSLVNGGRAIEDDLFAGLR